VETVFKNEIDPLKEHPIGDINVNDRHNLSASSVPSFIPPLLALPI
jgi:hypothetical protein